MNRHQYFERHKSAGFAQAEIDRKWRILEEQERMDELRRIFLLEQLSSTGKTSAAAMGVGGGEVVSIVVDSYAPGTGSTEDVNITAASNVAVSEVGVVYVEGNASPPSVPTVGFDPVATGSLGVSTVVVPVSLGTNYIARAYVTTATGNTTYSNSFTFTT